MNEKTFAKLLERHIRDNGYTNYEAARAAQINRVNLQRYLSGARVPASEVFEAILAAIPMNREEREEFCEAYELAADGTDTFYLRRFIREILEEAGDICGKQISQHIVEETDDSGNEIEIVDGAVAVERFMWSGITRHMTAGGETQAFLYFPADRFFAGRFLPTYEVEGDSVLSRLHITQLIPLSKRADQADDRFYNLQVLKNLIPLYFHAGSHYETCYYYRKNADGPGYGAVYPYYGVFENSVVLFSEDMEHAVRIRNEELVKKYREQFLSIAGHGGVTKKLVTFFEDTAKMLQFLTEHDKNGTEGTERYFIEYQPCLALAADRDLIASVIRLQGPQREMLLAGLMKRIDTVRDSSRLVHYFTENGLDEFIRTGVLAEYPASLVRPLTPAERIQAIESFLAVSEQENIEFGLIRDERLHLKKSINIFLSSACGLNLILHDEKQGHRHMMIDEPSICHVFGMFIGGMKEKRDVLSAEETRKVLLEKCAHLAEKIKNET